MADVNGTLILMTYVKRKTIMPEITLPQESSYDSSAKICVICGKIKALLQDQSSNSITVLSPADGLKPSAY
jgi:hypothetical protein